MDGKKKKKREAIISIIAVVGKNRAIGKDNKLLWKLPNDLERFKEITSNHPVIMGRKTYESIGHPLSGRANIVLSRKTNLKIKNCFIFDSLAKALKFAKDKDKDEVFIIGGESIFNEALPKAKKLYLTLVDDAPQADTYFPAYEDCFEIVREEVGQENHYRYKFAELSRIN